MKIEIEIKDDKFYYKTDVNGETMNGERGCFSRELTIFTDVLLICRSTEKDKYKEFMNEISVLALLEKIKKNSPKKFKELVANIK